MQTFFDLQNTLIFDFFVAMKEILCPIDFSSSSENALKYASHLAETIPAKIRVHHVLGRKIDPHQLNISLADEKLKDLIKKTSEETGITLETKTEVSSGDFLENMSSKLICEGAWMVVMGTKGASGLKEVFVGSNTVNLINRSSLPTLVIPDGSKFEPINNILYAADYRPMDNDYALQALKDIAEANSAEVRMVHVIEKPKEASEEKRVERHRQGHFFEPEVKYSYKVVKDKKGVVHGIKFYLDKKGDHGMVAMVKRKHGILHDAFIENRTERMAYHSSMPLLVMPDL